MKSLRSTSSLYEVQFILPVLGKVILPRIPNPLQLLHIKLVNSINLLLARLLIPDHVDRSPNHNIDWNSIGHQTHVVVKYPSRMEQRYRETEHFLEY